MAFWLFAVVALSYPPGFYPRTLRLLRNRPLFCNCHCHKLDTPIFSNQDERPGTKCEFVRSYIP
ncbi:hypothetical protein PSPTOT1_1793 [Pseudomonas syringae pv. tomato T1]|nr:hypothetical protein PSPTOT1_1793 [Pseudomonas syringae pv. tomato T1]